MKWERGLGIGLIFSGFYLIIINGVITGAAIGVGYKNIFGVFGVIVLLVGFLLIFSSLVLEERIQQPKLRVYPSLRYSGERKNMQYFLHDPHRIMTSRGEIELQDFKEAYQIIKEDEELIEMVREVYGRELKEIVSKRNTEESEIAMKFLSVLYEENIPKIKHDSEKTSEGYNLVYQVDDKLSMENQRIEGRLKNAIDNMEDILMRGGDPGIRSHSMGRNLNHIFEARAGVSGGPRIYYTKNPRNKNITILGYSIKSTAKEAEARLRKLYGK